MRENIREKCCTRLVSYDIINSCLWIFRRGIPPCLIMVWKGMSEMAQEIYRTHTCGELAEQNLDETVRLAGWVDTIRDHGGVAFLDLRDQYGVTQVVVHDDALLKDLHRETAITVSGKVVARDEETVNPVSYTHLRAHET